MKKTPLFVSLGAIILATWFIHLSHVTGNEWYGGAAVFFGLITGLAFTIFVGIEAKDDMDDDSPNFPKKK